MSDENPNQPPAKPTAKTSTVPLKKETVRITLRAKPGTGITQPKKSTGVVPEPKKATSPTPTVARKSTAPVPTLEDTIPVPLPTKSTAPIPVAPSSISAPGAPTAPGAPRPPAAPTGAKTVPLQSGAPTMPLGNRPTVAVPSPGGAPTMPLGQRPPSAVPSPGGAPTMPLGQRPPMATPAGAKTIPLAQAPGAVPAGKVTGQMRPAGTQALPRATVKLGATPTAPMSAPQKSAPVDSQLLEEERDPDSGMLVLAILSMILALAVMLMEMTTSDKIVNHPLHEATQLTVPIADDPSWDKEINGKYRSDAEAESFFRPVMPEVPKRSS